MFKKLINWFKKPTPMGNIAMKKLVEQADEEVLKALAAYKIQNPVKYEAKKEALFARYGIEAVSDEIVEEVEKEVKLKKAKKLNIV